MVFESAPGGDDAPYVDSVGPNGSVLRLRAEPPAALGGRQEVNREATDPVSLTTTRRDRNELREPQVTRSC